MENTRAGALATARTIVLACLAREFCAAEPTDDEHIVRTMLAFGRYRHEIQLAAPRRVAPRWIDPEPAPVRIDSPARHWNAFVTWIASRTGAGTRQIIAFVTRPARW